MNLLVFVTTILTIDTVLCDRPYYFDVNQLHEPLTNFDRVSKTVKYCIYMNNKTLDINYLIGTWYSIYTFSKTVNSIGGEFCAATNFTRPTKVELDAYKAKYNLQNETFTFDDGAVLCSQQNGRVKGIVVGNKTAKYYFLDTRSNQRLSGVYEVLTYKPINNNYMIYYQCNMRGHVKYLWSRRKDQTDAELESVLKPVYELEGLKKQRYCMKKKVVLTTPYY